VPAPATAGRGTAVLTVAVTLDEPSFPATSAGIDGGETSSGVTDTPAPAGSGRMFVDERRGDFSQGQDLGVDIVVSGAQQPGELADACDRK